MDRALLTLATSADETPPPGYTLSEISRATLSSYQACSQLIEFLLQRIKKDSNNVKFKCLVIIRHVCRSGRVDFKREMGRQIPVIKECMTYRGPIDQLRGDELNKRVREAAKEAMEAVVDSQMPVATSAVAASNRIQGLGGGGEDFPVSSSSSSSSSSSAYISPLSVAGEHEYGQMGLLGGISYSGNGGGGGLDTSVNGNVNGNGNGVSSSSSVSGSSHGGMAGIGNPLFRDPRDEQTWMQRAKAAGSRYVAVDDGRRRDLASLICAPFSAPFCSLKASDAAKVHCARLDAPVLPALMALQLYLRSHRRLPFLGGESWAKLFRRRRGY